MKPGSSVVVYYTYLIHLSSMNTIPELVCSIYWCSLFFHKHSRVYFLWRKGTLLSTPEICRVLKAKMLFAIKIACFKENFSQSFIFLLQVVKILLFFPYSFSSTELSRKFLHWALRDKPHHSGGGLHMCMYICMHLCIISNRTKEQLLSRCISTPA